MAKEKLEEVPDLATWNPPATVLYLLSPAKNGLDLDEALRQAKMSG
jgi:hypothetical protein